MPQDKVDVVRRLQDKGKIVALAGDGIADAAALALVDLGLAMALSPVLGLQHFAAAPLS